MKKLLLITLVPMTLLLQGSFLMKKGQSLKKIETQQDAGTNAFNSETSRGFNKNLTTFIHPGIYHTTQELNTVRKSIDSKQYKFFVDTYYNKTIRPAANFRCDSYNKGDTEKCNKWFSDAKVTEYYALRGYVEKNINYANKSVDAIDAWAKTFKDISGHNAPLLSSWQLYLLSRAAELLVHNDYGFVYPKDKKIRMIKYLDRIYAELQKPDGSNEIASSHIGGNWVSGILAAKQAYWILKHGVTTNNSEKNNAIKQYKYWASFNDSMVESYIYMNSDGTTPRIFNSRGIKKSIPKRKIYGAELWRLADDPKCFTQDGIGGEYWRDMWHMTMGLDFIGASFEMSNIQGYKDYYSKHAKRLTAGLEVIYAALLKKHKGNAGYYLKKTCSHTAATWNIPKITPSNKRTESAHAAAFYKIAKSKGWNIPLMTKYNNNYMDTAAKGNAPYDYDYVFKR